LIWCQRRCTVDEALYVLLSGDCTVVPAGVDDGVAGRGIVRAAACGRCPGR